MLSEDGCPELATLAAWFEVRVQALSDARDELARNELIGPSSRRRSAYELTVGGQATLLRLRLTGEQRLSDQLDGWRPQEHEELAALIALLSRECLSDAATVRTSGATVAQAR
jgi:hypothetical protein